GRFARAGAAVDGSVARDSHAAAGVVGASRAAARARTRAGRAVGSGFLAGDTVRSARAVSALSQGDEAARGPLEKEPGQGCRTGRAAGTLCGGGGEVARTGRRGGAALADRGISRES